MTVYIETIKSSGMQIKGEIKKKEHIKGIVENESTFELIRNKNWFTIYDKELYRIACVVM